MSRWIVTQDASDDLDQIHDYIARNHPRNATRFIEKIKQKFQTLAEYSGSGSRREEFGA